MKFPCSTTMASLLGNDEQHCAMDFLWGTTMIELRLQWFDEDERPHHDEEMRTVATWIFYTSFLEMVPLLAYRTTYD
jgi:hypothetical protein